MLTPPERATLDPKTTMPCLVSDWRPTDTDGQTSCPVGQESGPPAADADGQTACLLVDEVVDQPQHRILLWVEERREGLLLRQLVPGWVFCWGGRQSSEESLARPWNRVTREAQRVRRF
jgi:hypothetical protein